MSQYTKLFQSQQLKQEMKINPRLYQAMELLYMPLLDLQQHLKQELAQNPFLEMGQADVDRDVELSEDGDESAEEEEIDWEEILLDGFDAGGRKAQYEHKEYFQPTPVASRDLHDHLMDQLRLLDLDDRDMTLGEEIIGNIDESGGLSCSLEQVVEGGNAYLEDMRQVAEKNARELEDPDRTEELEEIERLFRPYTLEEAEEVLARVQRFDPPGVGARNLKESILIQMAFHDMEGSMAYQIVEEHFDDLINHRWSDIAKSMGISTRGVQDA
ncbi:MAG: hypothetical protein PVI57_15235, partial [Gemmatimonadota bacterium]